MTLLIFLYNHSLQLREPNACKALTILDDTSALLVQSWDTVLPRYWKADTGFTRSSDEMSRMGWGCGQDEEGIPASVFVFLQLMVSPIEVQYWCRDLIVTSKSLHKMDSRSISSAYSRSETSVPNVIFLLSPMSLAWVWNTIPTPYLLQGDRQWPFESQHQRTGRKE